MNGKCDAIHLEFIKVDFINTRIVKQKFNELPLVFNFHKIFLIVIIS